MEGERRRPEGARVGKAPLAREEESVEARRRRRKSSFAFMIMELDEDDVGFKLRLIVPIHG